MKLLFATGNSFKFALMEERLKELEDIELVSPKMLGVHVDVVEDGKTAEENSIKKAKAYYEATKMPTIAEDSGLYIEKFKESEQPGLFVKRINGVEGLSDEEVFNYYYNKITEYGGESKARYFTGVALVDADGEVHSNTLAEHEFLLTNKLAKTKSLNGGILEPMSFDLKANKYFDDVTKEEKEEHYKELNVVYRDLVKKYILDK